MGTEAGPGGTPCSLTKEASPPVGQESCLSVLQKGRGAGGSGCGVEGGCWK